MLKKRKKLVFAMTMTLVVLLTACSKFDAKGYAQAYFNTMFQGETEHLMGYLEGSKKSDLEKKHEAFVREFSRGLTEGLDISQGMQYQFDALCNEIFSTMRYDVENAEKISRKEYKVTIEYEPTDVFVKWTEYLNESANDMKMRAEAGEYKGTQEEIQQQIAMDIATESCELLDTAIMDASYQKEEKTILTLKKDKNGEFVFLDEEINDFTAKILCLDGIQE